MSFVWLKNLGYFLLNIDSSVQVRTFLPLIIVYCLIYQDITCLEGVEINQLGILIFNVTHLVYDNEYIVALGNGFAFSLV